MIAAGSGVVVGATLGVGAGAAGGFGALQGVAAAAATQVYRAGAFAVRRGARLGLDFGRGVVSGGLIAYRNYGLGTPSGIAGRAGEFVGQFGYGFAQGIASRGGTPIPYNPNPIVRYGQRAGQTSLYAAPFYLD